jgi:hypothetical protein
LSVHAHQGDEKLNVPDMETKDNTILTSFEKEKKCIFVLIQVISFMKKLKATD